MLLRELDSRSSIAKIVIATDQLKSDAEKGKLKNWDVDKLLDYFQKYDIILDRSDLYDMIKKAPMKDLISNIRKDEIVWQGEKSDELLTKPDEAETTVKSMAKKAMKKDHKV